MEVSSSRRGVLSFTDDSKIICPAALISAFYGVITRLIGPLATGKAVVFLWKGAWGGCVVAGRERGRCIKADKCKSRVRPT